MHSRVVGLVIGRRQVATPVIRSQVMRAKWTPTRCGGSRSAFPGTEEHDHGGRPSLRVHGRPRSASGLDDEGINLTLSEKSIAEAVAEMAACLRGRPAWPAAGRRPRRLPTPARRHPQGAHYQRPDTPGLGGDSSRLTRPQPGPKTVDTEHRDLRDTPNVTIRHHRQYRSAATRAVITTFLRRWPFGRSRYGPTGWSARPYFYASALLSRTYSFAAPGMDERFAGSRLWRTVGA